MCQTDFSGSGKFCSTKCEIEMIDIVSITVPPGWVKKTLGRLKIRSSQEKELFKFSTRHNYALRVLKKHLRIFYDFTLERKT